MTGHLHDFYIPAEQRMHLAHLEARLLEERKENSVTRCHWQQVGHQHSGRPGVGKIMSVCHTLRKMGQPTSRVENTCLGSPDMLDRISTKSKRVCRNRSGRRGKKFPRVIINRTVNRSAIPRLLIRE